MHHSKHISNGFYTLRLSLIAACFFLLKANSCDQKDEPIADRLKKSTSLLWEISGNGLEKPSYLYGTIHMIDKKDFFVRPLIDSMLLQSEQVAFEIKLDDMAALMSIQGMMQLPEGQTIQGMMEPADFEKLKKYFSDSLDVEIEELNDQKPFVLIQKLAENYIKGDLESFEIHFLMECVQHNKTILGLETVADQMAVFDSIPYAEQIGWLLDCTDSAAKYDHIFDDLVKFYKQEDLDSIARSMNESSPELMQYADAFIYERNKKWVPEIIEMIKNKTTFIAVGAGHLPGPQGVIELLRKEGFTLRPI